MDLLQTELWLEKKLTTSKSCSSMNHFQLKCNWKHYKSCMELYSFDLRNKPFKGFLTSLKTFWHEEINQKVSFSTTRFALTKLCGYANPKLHRGWGQTGRTRHMSKEGGEVRWFVYSEKDRDESRLSRHCTLHERDSIQVLQFLSQRKRKPICEVGNSSNCFQGIKGSLDLTHNYSARTTNPHNYGTQAIKHDVFLPEREWTSATSDHSVLTWW